MDKLHWRSAADIACLIRGKKVSASEVLEHFFARVDRFLARGMCTSYLCNSTMPRLLHIG